MVQYQGEQIKVSPFILVCPYYHHRLHYLPKNTEHKAMTHYKCYDCNEQYRWHYVSTSTGNWLRLLDDKKLQQITQEFVQQAKDKAEKEATEQAVKEQAELDAKNKLVEDEVARLKAEEKNEKDKEKEQLKKEKAEKQKEARILQKRLKALEAETGPIEITNTGEIPEP